MSALIEHLESRLGRIQSGWTHDPGGMELGFQVAEFRGGGQLEGSTSYATIGLSRYPLTSAPGDRGTRMELLMTTHSAQAPARLPQSVQEIAKGLTASQKPILRGEVRKLPGPVASGSDLSFLYAAIPGYFDEDFEAVTLDEGMDVVIVWLVPVNKVEAHFVHERGWPMFEERWVDQDPDLLDLFRPQVALA